MTTATMPTTPVSVAARTAEDAAPSAASEGVLRARAAHHDEGTEHHPVPAPRVLLNDLPLDGPARETVTRGRAEVRAALRGEDPRPLVVVGPCSLHDPEAALEYADRLAAVRRRLGDALCLVMRAYLEKPRTTIGWRGLLYDPHLDGSLDMEAGLRLAREVLLAINARGVPVASEVLDPATPAYYADLLAFASIGARTAESQPHRALASGLSLPVGIKNGTQGAVQTAVDALIAAREPHSYLGMDADGRCSMVRTRGNRDGALILRGGRATGPNYDAASVADAAARLREVGLNPAVLVDCSHANSGYEPARQVEICREVLLRQRKASGDGASSPLRGVLLESHLYPGKQGLPTDLSKDGGEALRVSLRYGVSVTDACLGWDDTEALLEEVAAARYCAS